MSPLCQLTIGDGCILSTDALLQPHTFEKKMLKLDTVTLGEGVYIGVYSIILPGANIDDGAVVGDWTLIMRNEQIQSDSHWQGNPASFIRNLQPSKPKTKTGKDKKKLKAAREKLKAKREQTASKRIQEHVITVHTGKLN